MLEQTTPWTFKSEPVLVAPRKVHIRGKYSFGDFVLEFDCENVAAYVKIRNFCMAHRDQHLRSVLVPA